MNYLTAEQILFIHYRLIEETGGSHGIRDITLLQSAIARPQAIFANNDLYPDIFTKAAALMHSIIKNHPFVDGNKRTGTVAAGLFLELNGYHLNAKNKDLESFALKAAVSRISLSEIADWLRRKSE